MLLPGVLLVLLGKVLLCEWAPFAGWVGGRSSMLTMYSIILFVAVDCKRSPQGSGNKGH